VWVVACLLAAGLVEWRALCHTAVAPLLPSQHKSDDNCLATESSCMADHVRPQAHTCTFTPSTGMHAIPAVGARHCLDMQWCTLTTHMLRACCLTSVRPQSNAPEVLPSGAAVLRVPQPLERIHGLHGDAALSLRRADVSRHPAAQWRRCSGSACMLDAKRTQTALPPCVHVRDLRP
jgi:hypothetical protein